MKHVKTSQWVIGVLIFVSVFVNFIYTDLTSLTIWSTNIWDCLFEEGIRNYYLYSSLNVSGAEHAIVGNDILVYIPWAIWNLPIWLISKTAGIEISTNTLMLLYSKLFLVFVFSGVLYLTGKICKELELDDENIMMVIYLTLSSAFVFTSIGYAGQNDILPIFFFLLGLLSLLRGKQYYFLLYAAISVAMKPYMLFSVIILVLLVEKKPWKILGKLFFAFSFYIVQRVVLNTFPYYEEAMSAGAKEGEIGLLLQAKNPIAQYDVSVLVLLLGVIAILAYFKKMTEQDYKRYVVYYATLPILLLFMTAGYSFYRPLYLVPLIYILFVMNKKIPLSFQLFLEIGLVGCMYYQFMRVEGLFYNPYYINGGVFGRIFDTSISKGNSFPEVLMRIAPDLPYYFAISSAVIVVIFLMLIAINHPKFSYEIPLESWNKIKAIPYLRLGVYVLLTFVALFGWKIG